MDTHAQSKAVCSKEGVGGIHGNVAPAYRKPIWGIGWLKTINSKAAALEEDVHSRQEARYVV